MSSTMLNIHVVQPRMMSVREAAAYVGLPIGRFSSACSVPAILMPGNVDRYDVRDLDAWLDRIKDGESQVDDAILSLLDQKAG